MIRRTPALEGSRQERAARAALTGTPTPSRAICAVAALLLFGAFLVITQAASDPTFVYDKAEYLLRPYDMKGLLKLGVYATTYALAAAALFAVIVSRSRTGFVTFLVVVVLCAGLNLFYQLLGSPTGFTGDELELIIHEAGQARNALTTYADLLAKTLTLAALFVLLAVAVRRLLTLRVSPLWLLLVPLSVTSTLYASRRVGDVKIFYYPPLQNVLATSAERLLPDPDRLVFFERRAVTARPFPGATPPEHVLLLLDESVNGFYLSVNGYGADTTPWLSSVVGKDDGIVNFGVANSVSNASAWSNLIVRIGLTPDDIDDFNTALTHLPTIFQFAKVAGYETLLIDGQTDRGQLQNYLTRFDAKFLDAIWYKDGADLKYERDFHLLERYLRHLEAPGEASRRTFTVFVRSGAHWPWADKYPLSAEVFRPAQRSTFGGMTEAMKTMVTNTYRNALRYNVDGFLAVAVDALRAHDVWTLYTSDHGVSIFEDGTPRTHGSTEHVPNGQLAVPLMVFGAGAAEEFPDAAGGRFSQFQIFPTLLYKMGFGTDVIERYGPTLHRPWPAGRERVTYITGKHELVPFLEPTSATPN